MSIKKKIKDAYSTAKQYLGIQDGYEVLRSKAMRRRDVTNPQNAQFTAELQFSWAQLELIYLTSWVARKIVNLTAKHIFRNGWTLKTDNSTLTADVIKMYNQHNLDKKNRRAIMERDIYGGSYLIMKNDFQDPSRPHDPTVYGKYPDKTSFVNMDVSYSAITPFTNIGNEDYYEPKIISLPGITLDPSNALLFRGVWVPTRRIPNYRYMGMSKFQHMYQAMITDDLVSRSIANLVYRSNVMFYKMPGYKQLLADNNEELILKHIRCFEDTKSIFDAGVMDKEDEIELVSQQFNALADIDKRASERLAAATDFPATVLLNKSPDGQNSTGESDMEILYSYISGEQAKLENEVLPPEFEVLIQMVAGEHRDFKFEFNPPKQIKQTEQLDVDQKTLANASSMQALGVDDEIILQYMVKNSLINEDEAEEASKSMEEMRESAEEDPQDEGKKQS